MTHKKWEIMWERAGVLSICLNGLSKTTQNVTCDRGLQSIQSITWNFEQEAGFVNTFNQAVGKSKGKR
jgi:hypothetical protein